jgi:hypothetical protein
VYGFDDCVLHDNPLHICLAFLFLHKTHTHVCVYVCVYVQFSIKLKITSLNTRQSAHRPDWHCMREKYGNYFVQHDAIEGQISKRYIQKHES